MAELGAWGMSKSARTSSANTYPAASRRGILRGGKGFTELQITSSASFTVSISIPSPFLPALPQVGQFLSLLPIDRCIHVKEREFLRINRVDLLDAELAHPNLGKKSDNLEIPLLDLTFYGTDTVLGVDAVHGLVTITGNRDDDIVVFAELHLPADELLVEKRHIAGRQKAVTALGFHKTRI